MRDFAVFPRAFHHFSITGAKPFEMAVFPYRWQGGQQLDFPIMALQQHLGDASRAAEVAINLERRMGAEEVGIGACLMASVKMNGRLEEVPQKTISMVTIVKTRPKADFPSPRPTCAFVTTAVQGLAAGIHQFWRFGLGQHGARIKSKKMRHMAMLRFHFLVVFQPFLQITLLADLHRWKMGFRNTEAVSEDLFHT